MNNPHRVVAVLLQVVIPGGVSAFLTLVMGLLMLDLMDSPGAFLPLVVFAGLVVGFPTWLFGLIADRASGQRLLLTILCTTGGALVSFLVLYLSSVPYFSSQWLPPRPPTSALAIASTVRGVLILAGPLAGALVGYYWVGGKLHPNPPARQPDRQNTAPSE
jgi:hypothetical protein